MSVNDQLVSSGPDIFYDKEFFDVLEDHLPYLRQYASSPIVLSPGESYQWRGDFYGLLDGRQIARQYHRLVLRLNNYTSPLQFNEETLSILLPDLVVVNQIAQSHRPISSTK